jgi:ABC-2 type transport system permease protein
MPDRPGGRLLAIARKEARQLIRDPAYLGLAVVVPLLLILLLGYQLSLDVKGLLACSIREPTFSGEHGA